MQKLEQADAKDRVQIDFQFVSYNRTQDDDSPNIKQKLWAEYVKET